MERGEDKSILITDKEFQKVLLEWRELSETQKTEVYQKYELTENELNTLRQLFLSLDFCEFEQPQSDVEEALGETLWKLAEQKITTEEVPLITKLYRHFARIAAILIIPILFYAVYIQFAELKKQSNALAMQQITVTSQAGTVTKLILPDGSKVFLNAGSTISYPVKFDTHLRKVNLTGEGFFEVVKNKQVPMVVSTGKVNLKVYGTSFNVNAFQSEKFVKVTLVEGSVSLSTPEGNIDGENEFFITPGQTVTYLENSRNVILQNDDTFLYTAWKDGILIFRNDTFETVLRQLSGKFNVDIELKDKSLASIPMDATFRDENINEILRLLSLSTPFKYYYANPQMSSDGTYTKSKIYIERK